MDAADLAESHAGASGDEATAVADPVDRKRISTARARAALRGIVVHVFPVDGGRAEYVVSQGRGWTRTLNSIEELEAWLDRVDGGHP